MNELSPIPGFDAVQASYIPQTLQEQAHLAQILAASRPMQSWYPNATDQPDTAQTVGHDPMLTRAMAAAQSPAMFALPPGQLQAAGVQTQGGNPLAALASFFGNALPMRGGLGPLRLHLMPNEAAPGAVLNVADTAYPRGLSMYMRPGQQPGAANVTGLMPTPGAKFNLGELKDLASQVSDLLRAYGVRGLEFLPLTPSRTRLFESATGIASRDIGSGRRFIPLK